jgi:2-keto-4-pentenoate hydratase/2-oxohepta-3-ene-1,7-dioic acid hydratase in catechol pathway
MKLVTFLPPGVPEPRVGVLTGEDRFVLDLDDAARTLEGAPASHFSSMLALLEGGADAMDHALKLRDGITEGLTRAVETVQLLAPVPRPISIRDCMAFEKHIVQATRTVVKWKFPPAVWLDSLTGGRLIRPPKVWYERPVYYKGNPNSVVGPEAVVRWPSFSERLDFELEFGVFIGRQGRDIEESEAASYVAGYTIFNDFSARDTQLREMQGRLGPAKGKDFDTGNVMGPWLVTPDEIADPYALAMTARVNGEEWSRASTGDLHFRIEEIIAYISRDETLYPGDFIGAGTAPGGCGLELDRWIQAGDVVELEVEGLGVLRNGISRKDAETPRI